MNAVPWVCRGKLRPARKRPCGVLACKGSRPEMSRGWRVPCRERCPVRGPVSIESRPRPTRKKGKKKNSTEDCPGKIQRMDGQLTQCRYFPKSDELYETGRNRIFQHLRRLLLPGTLKFVPCLLNEPLVDFREEYINSGIGRFCALKIPTDSQLWPSFDVSTETRWLQLQIPTDGQLAQF